MSTFHYSPEHTIIVSVLWLGAVFGWLYIAIVFGLPLVTSCTRRYRQLRKSLPVSVQGKSQADQLADCGLRGPGRLSASGFGSLCAIVRYPEAVKRLSRVCYALRISILRPSHTQEVTVPRGILLTGSNESDKFGIVSLMAYEVDASLLYVDCSVFARHDGPMRMRDFFAQVKKIRNLSDKPVVVLIQNLHIYQFSHWADMEDNADKEPLNCNRTLDELLMGMCVQKPNNGVLIVATAPRSDLLHSRLLAEHYFGLEVAINNPS